MEEAEPGEGDVGEGSIRICDLCLVVCAGKIAGFLILTLPAQHTHVPGGLSTAYLVVSRGPPRCSSRAGVMVTTADHCADLWSVSIRYKTDSCGIIDPGPDCLLPAWLCPLGRQFFSGY